MKTFRSLMLLAVVLVFSVGAMAQTDSTVQAVKLTPQQRAEKLTVSMSRHLLLSPEQIEQVRGINLKYAEMRQPGVRPAREDRKATMEARNAEMEKVLNPAQYQKFLQLERKAIRGMKDRMKAKRDTANQPEQPAAE